MPDPVRRAHPALRHLVNEYVGYDQVLDPAAVHFGLPSGVATVIIAFDEPLDVGWVDPGVQERQRYWMMAGGLHLRPALITTHGRQHGIQLSLTPRGARTLLGLPLGQLRGIVAHHDQIPRGLPSWLHERLAATPEWEARFDILEGHLLSVAADDPAYATAPEVVHAWRLLRRTRGGMPVARVAGEVGWSRRHLGARFAAEYGVSPKQAARLMRFEYANALARSRLAWADVAHEAGYADQAHLVREWTEFAGRGPTATMGEAFPNLQDPKPGAKSS